MVMHIAKNGAVYDLLVMTADRPGLFSKVTGVLSFFGMNIIRAQAFSNRHGTIFDLISFEDPDHYFEKNPTEPDHSARPQIQKRGFPAKERIKRFHFRR